MTALGDLLGQNGIHKAVVIDDVFDEVPRPDELNEADWSIFFDDLGEDGHKQLAEIYPPYNDTQVDDLRLSQEFITVLWENRNSLPPGPRDSLFREYESTNATERAGLDALVTALQGMGLTCQAMGRDLSDGAKDADLIFVDLFLGHQQSQDDMGRAIKRVSELISGREQNPPLVVLMSRSPRLWDKRNDFRDNVGLLGSTFRVVSKAELAKDGTLVKILTRLVSHYEDAKRVAKFVHAWDSGLKQARKSFITILRRLDLADLAQIRTLLLDFEGQQLGDYLLDVADRVLQHEIEADAGTIDAARELNKIELAKYPAPHLAGTPDLQDLVRRMIFQHPRRLEVSINGHEPRIQFGDLLRFKNLETGVGTENVLLVVTPACDLARYGTNNVLVLPGVLKPLSAGEWSYGSSVSKSPIFESSDGSRYWIKWDLKGRHTIHVNDLRQLLVGTSQVERIGHLREIYAIEIQQRMLADMGRIGQPANPPATFPVSISLYVVTPGSTARSVPVDALNSAVCFVGRDADAKRVDHLVLSEYACDALQSVIHGLSAEDVHDLARASLTALKAELTFLDKFERGIIEVPQKNGKWTEAKGGGNSVYIYIVRNEGVEDGDSIKGNHRCAPFVMKISDIIPVQDE